MSIFLGRRTTHRVVARKPFVCVLSTCTDDATTTVRIHHVCSKHVAQVQRWTGVTR